MTQLEIWAFSDAAVVEVGLTDFKVEAPDGEIGTVHEVSTEAGASYLVVETNGLLRSKKLMIPAGLVSKIDLGQRTIFVDRAKDEIENAPQFDEEVLESRAYRADLGGYYFTRDRSNRVLT